MKPQFLLAACSLLAPQALVAASGDYPPPTGPYRTPKTLESLADQARAVLDTLNSSPAEAKDQPERHHPGPTATLPQLTSAYTERSAYPGGESGLAPAFLERDPATAPARREGWGQADFPPPGPESRAFSQAGASWDPDHFGVSPRHTADSRPQYAQADLPYFQPDNRPYAAAEHYTGSSADTGYYGVAPLQQGYRYTASDPSGYYATEGYRETPGMAGTAERGTSSDAWSYYPQDDYTHAYTSSVPYPQQPRDQAGQPASSQPPSLQAGGYIADPGSYAEKPLVPLFPAMTGDAAGYYGVDAYGGSYRNPLPFGGGQPGSAPAYTGVAAQPRGAAVPSHKAAYAQDSWPYGSGSSPQTLPSGQWTGQYRPASEGLASDYPAYHGGYVAPREADPLAAPGYLAPAAPPLRYRQSEPAGTNVYYGDYQFAPPAPGRNSRHQDTPRQGAAPDGFPDSGPQPGASRFRNAGQTPSSVTGPGGRVYRYRPIQEAHSSAPHAQTWEPKSYPPPKDYRDQDWTYPNDSSADYLDRWLGARP